MSTTTPEIKDVANECNAIIIWHFALISINTERHGVQSEIWSVHVEQKNVSNPSHSEHRNQHAAAIQTNQHAADIETNQHAIG